MLKVTRTEIVRRADGITVTAYAANGNEELRVGGYGLPVRHSALAERLARAMKAGVVYGSLSVEPTIDGKGKWVRTSNHMLGRMLNAELRRAGY